MIVKPNKKKYKYEIVRAVLDEDLRKDLERLAKARDLSMSGVVRELIREAAAKLEVEYS